MAAFMGPDGSGLVCVCCANQGALPHLPGLPEAVTPGTIQQMCDECIGAAFLGAGPHPHPFEPFEAAS